MKNKKKGFSLIEVVVALAVISVGVLNRVEIWDKDKWQENNSYDDMDEVAEHMAELGLSI